MCDQPLESLMKNAVWPGGVQPHFPPFAGKPPPVLPVATSVHDHDTFMVSVGGKAPEAVTCSRFGALLRDGISEGVVHVGVTDGTVITASFEQLRTYIYYRPTDHPGHIPDGGAVPSPISFGSPQR